MRRRLASATLVLCAVLATVLGAFPAGAQTLDEVVDAVERTGYYVDEGADVDAGDLAAVLEPSDAFAVVVLATDDPDGADFAANQVLGALDGDHTVLVISPGEVGAASDDYTDAELDDALDATLDRFDAGGSTTEATVAFAQSLGIVVQVPESSNGTTNDDSGGGSGAGLLIFLLVIVAVIVGLFWWARRKATKVDADEVERARTEIRAQLEVVAHAIVEYEDEIDLSENREAIEHFRAANATYAEVGEAVTETDNLIELADLNDRVDEARWQLEAAQALIEGRAVPPKPEPEKPAACFFDPTHKPGSEECTIKTSAGNKEVLVCRSCADKLERGEKPEPRMIDVGGKRVPAAKAPRSHGGLGMGGLSIFEVILGGLGALAATRGRSRPSPGRAAPSQRRPSSAGVDIDWGEMLPTRRPRGDVFGQDRLPPRPRTLPRTAASRPRGMARRSRRRPSGSGRSRRRR